MTDITLKISREMAKRALDACEVNNDRDAASALYKAITHAGINAVAHERMQEAFDLLRQWVAVVDLSGMEAEDGAIPDNPSLNPVTELLRKTRALTAK